MKKFDFEPMNNKALKEICSWEYEQPYSVYNYMTYEDALKNQTAITKAENAHKYLCFWNNETLVAYTSIIPKEERVYIGIGIAPQFCGQGLGKLYLNKTINECRKRHPDKEIWVQVRSWNERAIKCYCKGGFAVKYRKVIPDRFNRNTEFIFMCYDKMISFSYLDKTDFYRISHDIFNILADNMSAIAPTGNTREEDYKYWYEGVSEGLKRGKRQIVLIKDNESIIGFFQYYTNEDTFMMEEIQFKSAYQGKNIFRRLYGFLFDNISEDMKFVEAYANITNHKSIGILKKLGLSKIGMSKNGRCFHFKGKYADLEKWYKNEDK